MLLTHTFLLLITTLLLVSSQLLFLLDCGSHGEKMRNTILQEGYQGRLQYVPVQLEGCDPEGEVLVNTEAAYLDIFTDVISGQLQQNETEDIRLSLSYGVTYGQPSIALLALSRQRGVRIWAGAGNEYNKNGCQFPAAQEGVYAVTATDSTGELQPLSNGCEQKNASMLLRVTACSTSEATAIAAALGLQRNLTRALSPCPFSLQDLWIVKHSWWYTGIMLILLATFLLAMGIYYIVQRRARGQ
jgi:hypothetical protein